MTEKERDQQTALRPPIALSLTEKESVHILSFSE
jgi:hypothetical protein